MTKEQKYREALEAIEDKMFRDISSGDKIEAVYSIIQKLGLPRNTDVLVKIDITLDAETVLEEMLGAEVGETYSQVICNMHDSYGALLKQLRDYKIKIAERSEVIGV